MCWHVSHDSAGMYSHVAIALHWVICMLCSTGGPACHFTVNPSYPSPPSCLRRQSELMQPCDTVIPGQTFYIRQGKINRAWQMHIHLLWCVSKGVWGTIHLPCCVNTGCQENHLWSLNIRHYSFLWKRPRASSTCMQMRCLYALPRQAGCHYGNLCQGLLYF